MKAIGVYIYAGGFSIGVKENFDVVAHFEDPEPYGKEIIDLNREKYWGDMRIHPFPRWPDYEGIDLLYANPPCAPFSNANTRSFLKDSWRRDPRVRCWHNTAEYAIKNNIPFVCMETVPQAYSKAPSLLLEKAEEFQFAGYNTYIFLHNAMFFGSCQNRPRLLFIATKNRCLNMAEFWSKPQMTVGQKLSTLPQYDREKYSNKMNAKLEQYILATKPGQRLRKAWEEMNPEEDRVLNERGQVKGRPTFGVKKLDENDQMVTIVGYDLIHPTEPRLIDKKEYQVLGDYPFDYEFKGGSSTNSYVARGVSASVGRWLGKTAKLTLEKPEVPVGNCLNVINALQGFDKMTETFIEIKPGAELPKMSLRSKGF